MKNLVKILTCVVIYVLTFGVLLNWVGDIPTAHAGAPRQGNWIAVPAGTRILIRLTEALSSANQRAGARFVGQLETNLMAQGVVAAPRGTTVHGQVVAVEAAGRMAGGSELALQLTDIVINDTAHPIMTDTYQLQGQGQGAIAGGGRGAAIGAAAGGGLGTARAASGGGGQQVSLARGAMLEFRLQQPASLPRPR
jgi:hypothetical protein